MRFLILTGLGLAIMNGVLWAEESKSPTASQPATVADFDPAMEVEPEEPVAGTERSRGDPSPVPPAILDDLVLVQPDPDERAPSVMEAPNEVVLERVILRGALIQWLKTDNPLQLFNPFAPERYGTGEQNLTYDGITGRPKGITILAIDFGGKRQR